MFSFGRDEASMIQKEKEGTATLFSETTTKHGQKVSIYIEPINAADGFNTIVLVPKNYEGKEQFSLDLFYGKKTDLTPYARISKITVPRLHHKGYGSSLLQTTIDFLKANNFSEIVLTIKQEQNDPEHLHALITFYKKFGFIVNEDDLTAFKTL